MTLEHFRAHEQFLLIVLNTLQHELKPLAPQMSMECQFELETLGRIARSFFRMANQEIFSQQKASVLNGK